MQTEHCTTPVSSEPSNHSGHNQSDDHSHPKSKDQINLIQNQNIPITKPAPIQPSVTRPKRPNQCSLPTCSARLNLAQTISNRCHCQQLFCDQHRLAERHQCSFDFALQGKQNLSQQNPIVIGTKINRI